MQDEEQKTLGNLLDNAETTPDEYPKNWDYREIGSRIMGEITRIEFDIPVTSDYSDVSNLIEIDTGDGLRTVWLPTVLKNKVKKMGIIVSDKIGIEALGRPTNKRYYDFKVVKLK